MREGALLALALLSAGQALPASPPPRESITFILGEDEDPSHAMYRHAAAFFMEDPLERTDHMEFACRSLREIRDRLARHEGPWGVVNLVVHGSAQGRMDLAVIPGGDRLTEPALAGALGRGLVRPLPDALVDARTEVRLHGCGLGRQKGLLGLFSRALGGRDAGRPLVRASPYFTCFQELRPGGGGSVRFLGEVWQQVLPDPGPKPLLAARFLAMDGKAPAAGALDRHSARFPGDTFQIEGPVTFLWTRIYDREGQEPRLSGQASVWRWLLEQPEARRALWAAGLAPGQLAWEARSLRKSWQGVPLPALEARGRGWCHRLVRALPGPEDAWCPTDWNDARYYTSAR